jgi:hypothetical protein
VVAAVSSLAPEQEATVSSTKDDNTTAAVKVLMLDLTFFENYPDRSRGFDNMVPSGYRFDPRNDGRTSFLPLSQQVAVSARSTILLAHRYWNARPGDRPKSGSCSNRVLSNEEMKGGDTLEVDGELVRPK